MSDINMTSLADKLQDLNLFLKTSKSLDVGYGRVLREAIVSKNHFMEVEVLKSLGDLHLQKGKLTKDSAEFDKAAALYAVALLRCPDPDMGETLDHRIGYMEKLSRQLLQGYTPQYEWLSPDYWGTADINVLRVAETCAKTDNSLSSVKVTYTEILVTALSNGDIFLELEALKSLGDFYLQKGKETTDASQFAKAAAMYNKALTVCEDPDTEQTLHHRILYMEKIREAVRRQPSQKKYSMREKSPHVQHQSGNITRTDIVQHPQLNQDAHIPSEYNDYLQKGNMSLSGTDLNSAEKHFAAALYAVFVKGFPPMETELTEKEFKLLRALIQNEVDVLNFRFSLPDPTAQQYQREVEPLCKLGEVYSKRGQQTRDGGDFVKAAALYNAAIARSSNKINGSIETAIKEVERTFLNCVLDIHSNASKDETEKHKKQLKEMRDQIKLEMETIGQQLDPYVHDEDDPCVKEIEAKRAQAVRQLFERIAQQRKEFISLLVEECIGLMGPPPCKYALIGLGSQATGLVTPYSDLEFAILVEQESEECLVYFRNLTHYLHLKVVNLGETILPALGIKCLNDFYSKNPLDNWYYDSVTPRGFALDGSMPKASKTPLGRQATMTAPSSELIATPESMAIILQNDVTLYLKEGYHLATILRNPCLIAGDHGLIDKFMAITGKILQADGGKMAEQLAQETMEENIKSYDYTETMTARLIDVKKEIYRFPAVAVDCLALSSHIIPTTVWKTIEQMEKQRVIGPKNTHHLLVLTSISAELRLRTYIANGGQKENLSALASMETELQGQESSPHTNDELLTKTLKPVFHLPNEKQLIRYYSTAHPLKYILSKWSGNKPVVNSHIEFIDNSPRVLGKMYAELFKFNLAIRYYSEATQKVDGNVTEKMMLHSNQGDAWGNLGDYRKAKGYYEQALQMSRSIYGQTAAHPNIAASLNKLGSALDDLEDYRKAISYYEQALQMFRSIHCQTKAHPTIAHTLNNIGSAWNHLGDYREAISYYEQALQMRRSIYGHTAVHRQIATLLNNLGKAWNNLRDYRKANSYHEQAMQMFTSIYGQTTAHPKIAMCFYNLGVNFFHLDHCRKAIRYFEQALQICRSIYGQTTPHPHIILKLINLGEAWYHLKDYRKAIGYYEQALQMQRSIYGQAVAHLHTANLLNKLGLAWGHLGDYRKAISYYEQALQMKRSIYGKTTAHPNIVNSLNNMGSAWHNLGSYTEAIRYDEQALQMKRCIYGQTTEHPDIATSLNNLGESLRTSGDHRKAISYYEQALQMLRSIYGQTTAHPDIATSLNNLGRACDNLGDCRKAIRYHEQALQMYRSIYGQTTAHHDIATSLNNLGESLRTSGDYRKAISYHEQALQMCRSIYGQTTAHPNIATSLNNLGGVWHDLGDHRKAISYYEQALQMNRSIYGQTTAHPDIATSLSSLGESLRTSGDYRKAIMYHEQALKMKKSVYGETTAHPDIAISLNNLGLARDRLSDHNKAISYYEQALQMQRDIYGQTTAHLDIATSLTNLGVACINVGDHRKSLSYCEQALKMYRSIHGQTTAHPDIAKSLNNLGGAWDHLGDHRKAISTFEEALAMAKQVYPQNNSHPLIPRIENNLIKAASADLQLRTTSPSIKNTM